MIQEPYISKQGKLRATQGWLMVYPTGHDLKPSATRTVTLINQSISTNTWSSIPLETQDAVVIVLQAPAESIIVVNIYSDGSSTVTWDIIDSMLHKYTSEQWDGRGLPYRFICAGDYNTHHLLWDEP